MRARRLGALAATLLVIALAGCGQASGPLAPKLAQLPLVNGTEVTVAVQRCDRGANAYCAWELVVVGPRYRNSNALLVSERRRLKKLGWTGANGDTGVESAADSPGHKLRVTYSTALGDLRGIDLNWIKRSRKVTLALSRALFDRAPAISMSLEVGSA